MKHKLTIHEGSIQRTIYIDEAKSLHSHLLANGYFISSPCGGNGRCGKCKVTARGDFLPPYGYVSEWSDLLACKAYPAGDCEVFCKALPQAVRHKKASTQTSLGIAFDIGTTSISAVLCDLDTKEELTSVTERNAQCAYGADVITRLTYDYKKLSDVLISQINDIIQSLCDNPNSVLKITFAANTVMSHYITHLSPEKLACAPFEPSDTFGKVYSAKELGIIAESAEIFIFPSLASFVGGDISAGIFALDILSKEHPSLLLDVGTNGEAALWKDSTLYVTSAAAGPAFEGSELSCGMTAESGAVISFDGKEFKTVDNAPPCGIAGSGVIDILSELVKSGAVDKGGRLLSPDETPAFSDRISMRNDEVCFDISNEVFLAASDIRKLQLAKAAIRASLSFLLKKSETALSEINSFYLAGAFGASIRTSSASDIGLIPHELASICKPSGNSALQGATLALFEDDIKEKLAKITDVTHHVDLSGDAEFEEEFLRFIPM